MKWLLAAFILCAICAGCRSTQECNNMLLYGTFTGTPKK
jgi:hypothetical protein